MASTIKSKQIILGEEVQIQCPDGFIITQSVREFIANPPRGVDMNTVVRTYGKVLHHLVQEVDKIKLQDPERISKIVTEWATNNNVNKKQAAHLVSELLTRDDEDVQD